MAAGLVSMCSALCVCWFTMHKTTAVKFCLLQALHKLGWSDCILRQQPAEDLAFQGPLAHQTQLCCWRVQH